MREPFGTLSQAPVASSRPVNLNLLMRMVQRGEKIAMLSVCDATFAAVAGLAGVECLWVSHDMVTHYQGQPHRTDVPLEALAYHVKNVTQGLLRANTTAWILCDLSDRQFLANSEKAMSNAVTLMQAGANMINLPVHVHSIDTARFLVERGIPVCAHLGPSLPSHQLDANSPVCQGNGRDHIRWLRLVLELQDAGAQFVLLDRIEANLGTLITKAMTRSVTFGLDSVCPTAGLVSTQNRLLELELSPGATSKEGHLSSVGSVSAAIAAFVSQVKTTGLLGKEITLPSYN